MKIARFDNPLLSFNPSVLFVEKQDDIYYKVFANGFEIGTIINRNKDWAVSIEKYELTGQDKDFLINAAKSL